LSWFLVTEAAAAHPGLVLDSPTFGKKQLQNIPYIIYCIFQTKKEMKDG